MTTRRKKPTAYQNHPPRRRGWLSSSSRPTSRNVLFSSLMAGIVAGLVGARKEAIGINGPLKRTLRGPCIHRKKIRRLIRRPAPRGRLFPHHRREAIFPICLRLLAALIEQLRHALLVGHRI